jgi:cellulose biosynthesis protein BcsQ
MRTVAVYNIKGGVGKTAAAVNLAWFSARAGARTLLWDLDPQGAATFYFRVQPKIRGSLKKLLLGRRPLTGQIRGTDFDGLDLLPADFAYRNLDLKLDATADPLQRLAQLLRPLSRDYDHLYLDCAPSISLVSEGVFAAADVLLVPTIPTTLSLRTLEQLSRHLAASKLDGLRVLPFFSMVDRRKSMHREIAARTRDSGFDFLATQIPYSSEVEAMGQKRAPLATYAPRGDAARAFEELWREVFAKSGSWLSAYRG